MRQVRIQRVSEVEMRIQTGGVSGQVRVSEGIRVVYLFDLHLGTQKIAALQTLLHDNPVH